MRMLCNFSPQLRPVVLMLVTQHWLCFSALHLYCRQHLTSLLSYKLCTTSTIDHCKAECTPYSLNPSIHRHTESSALKQRVRAGSREGKAGNLSHALPLPTVLRTWGWEAQGPQHCCQTSSWITGNRGERSERKHQREVLPDGLRYKSPLFLLPDLQGLEWRGQGRRWGSGRDTHSGEAGNHWCDEFFLVTKSKNYIIFRNH